MIDMKLVEETIKECKTLKALNDVEATRIIREQFKPAIQKTAKKLSEEKAFDPKASSEVNEEEYDTIDKKDPMVEQEPEEETPIEEVPEVEPETEEVPETEPEEKEMLMDDEELDKIVDEMIDENPAPEETIDDEIEKVDEPIAETEVPEVEPETEEVPVVPVKEEDSAEEIAQNNISAKDKVVESEKNKKEKAALLSENKKLKSIISSINKDLNEAKLDRVKNLYLQSVLKMPLTKEQKYMIAERFDEATQVEQVKMIYDTIKEAVKVRNKITNRTQPKLKSVASLTESTKLNESTITSDQKELYGYFEKLVTEKHY